MLFLSCAVIFFIEKKLSRSDLNCFTADKLRLFDHPKSRAGQDKNQRYEKQPFLIH